MIADKQAVTVDIFGIAQLAGDAVVEPLEHFVLGEVSSNDRPYIDGMVGQDLRQLPAGDWRFRSDQ